MKIKTARVLLLRVKRGGKDVFCRRRLKIGRRLRKKKEKEYY